MSREESLLAAICASPDDDDVRLIYADFLEDRGEANDSARAEFIRAQIELSRPAQPGNDERRKELSQRVRQLHMQHAAAWAEPIQKLAQTRDFWKSTRVEHWDRGFLTWLHVPTVAVFREHAAELVCLTPVRQLWINRFDEPDVIQFSTMPEIAVLCELTLICSVRLPECRLGDRAMQALAESPYLSRLEKLDITQNAVGTEGLRALAHSPNLPALRWLQLYGNKHDDESVAMLIASPMAARMTEWWIGGGNLTFATAQLIAETPALGHMTHLSFDQSRPTDEGLFLLTDSAHLSNLLHLNLYSTDITSGGIEALADSPYLANLEEIMLAKTWIGEEGADALIDSPYLQKIRRINLYDAVPREMEEPLEERFGSRVEFGRPSW